MHRMSDILQQKLGQLFHIDQFKKNPLSTIKFYQNIEIYTDFKYLIFNRPEHEEATYRPQENPCLDLCASG